MSFKENNKDFKISLKAPSGNTVGFINLSTQFCNTVLGTKTPTYADIQKISKDPVKYLSGLTIEIEQLIPEVVTSADEY